MEQLHESSSRQNHPLYMNVFFMGMLAMLVSMVLVAAPAIAGGKGKHHGHNPEKRLQKLTKRLGLNEAQQGKVKSILEEKHHKLQGLHKQMKEIRQNARVQIEAQLTPEQAEKFNKQKKKRKHGKKKGKGQHGRKHKKEYDDDDEEDNEDENDDD